MKIYAIIIVALIILSSFVSALSFNDLTNEQKQVYWKEIRDCWNQGYTRACALAALQTASEFTVAQNWCEDSDGKDLYTKGVVTTNKLPKGREDRVYTWYKDTPKEKTRLLERACKGNRMVTHYIKAPKGYGYGDGVLVKLNSAPNMNPMEDYEITVEEILTFPISATDVDGDELVYSAENLPAGATFENQEFDWAPTEEQVGAYKVTFTVSDGELEDYVVVIITVNEKPNTMPFFDPNDVFSNEIFLNEGEELTFEVTATDAEGDELTYSVEPLPEGATFEEQTFSWTPNYEQAGGYGMTFKVSDGELEEVVFIVINVVDVVIGTDFCGIVSEDTILTKDNGPYLVKCHILVEKGITLEIEPGVEIRFDGNYYIKVEGQFIADGTKEEMIVFTSNKPEPQPGDWDKIKFEDSSIDWNGASGSVIRHSKIKYSGGTGSPSWAAITMSSASPLIESNILSNFANGFIWTQKSSPAVKDNIVRGGTGTLGNGAVISIITVDNSAQVIDNIIENNYLGEGNFYGISCEGAPLIKNNTFSGNSGSGISCIGSPTIENNTITDNEYMGLQIRGSATINHNVISNNEQVGIEISGGHVHLNENKVSGSIRGVQIQDSPLVIFENNTITSNERGVFIFSNSFLTLSKNNIYGNSEYDFYIHKNGVNSNDIYAQNNWWGTTNKDEIGEKIFDFYDDFDLGKVIYEPFATEPFEVW